MFAVLWCFDNFLAVAPLLGIRLPLASSVVMGFPNACYTIWLTLVILYFQAEWFRQVKMEPGARSMAQRALGLVTVLGGGSLVTNMLGLDPKALLAFGGMAGFATSLAVKDVLTNLFGGISLLLQRPFIEGARAYHPCDSNLFPPGSSEKRREPAPDA